MTDTMRSEYRELSEIEKELIRNVKLAGNELIAGLEQLGESREYSIAKTKFEEAIMWTVKGLTK